MINIIENYKYVDLLERENDEFIKFNYHKRMVTGKKRRETRKVIRSKK